MGCIYGRFFAWATLVSFVLTLPISPISDFIVNAMSAYSFGLVGLPLLAFAGIAVGDQLEVFKKLSWKIVIVSLENFNLETFTEVTDPMDDYISIFLKKYGAMTKEELTEKRYDRFRRM